MRKGLVYKHKYCIDVAIKVLYAIVVTDGLKIKMFWISISNPDKPFNMSLKETVVIPLTKLADWKYYEINV